MPTTEGEALTTAHPAAGIQSCKAQYDPETVCLRPKGHSGPHKNSELMWIDGTKHRAMGGHTIAHTHDGDSIRSVVTCHEPDGAFCRIRCTDCDEVWYECDMPCEGGCQHEPDEERLVEEGCNHPKGPHCTNGHPIIPCKCWKVENLDAEYGWYGMRDAYDGPTGVPVHDGPIISDWDDDHQVWRYA